MFLMMDILRILISHVKIEVVQLPEWASPYHTGQQLALPR